MYGNLGVCEVEEVVAQQFFGNSPKEYYTLHPFFSKSSDKIYVPTSTDASLRPILRPEEARKYLDSLKTTEVPVFCSRSQPALTLHYQDMLQTHQPLEQLKLFKELCQKEQLQKRKGRKLSPTDMHFYKLTEQLLSEEFALSLQESPATMRTRMHHAALS